MRRIYHQIRIGKIRKATMALAATCILALGSISVARAQEDCSEKLKIAENSYEVGNIESVEGYIAGCLLNKGFNDAEQEEALKLLVLVGLFEDDFPKAERNMIALLKTNPDFKPKASDPVELKNIYDLFRTDPVFTFGGRAGLNVGYSTTSRHFSVGNSATDNAWTYTDIGFQASLLFNYRITAGLYMNLEPSFSSVGFRDFGTYMYDSSIFVNYGERMTMVGGLVGFSNEFRREKKLKPTLRVAAGYYLFQTALTKIARDYRDESGLASIQESDVNIKANRTADMFTFNYGIDFKIKAGSRGHVLLGFRHNLGLTNITRTRYNDELLYRYYFVLDDMTLNSVMFELGYLQSVYKPKILKRKLEKNEK